MVNWIKPWLHSSQSCISINGELFSFFYCKRGVRQGDPLSPFRFILAADFLSIIFNKDRTQHVIKGLGPPIKHNTSITNCHYADDTILFLETSKQNMEAVRWGTMAFEAISRIKMNLTKIELYPLNTDQGVQLAQVFR